MELYLEDKSRIYVDDNKISSGGEGEVHRINYCCHTAYRNCCVKIYYKNKRNKNLHKKIRFMATNPPLKLNGGGFKICWPKACVYNESREFIGFVMDLAFENSQSLAILTSTNIRKSLDNVWEEKYGRKKGRQSVVNRLKIAHNLLLPICHLHFTEKYVLQDFKPDNVLLTPSGKISLIDLDSVQIKDTNIQFPGSAATPEYIPPEFYKETDRGNGRKMKSSSWDMFAVGVVNYQILFGIHPYAVTPKRLKDGEANDISSCIRNNYFAHGIHHSELELAAPHKFFEQLPPDLKHLFLNTFRLTSNRPGCVDWINCIRTILKDASKNKPEKKTKERPEERSEKYKSTTYTNKSTNNKKEPKITITYEDNRSSNGGFYIWLILFIVLMSAFIILCIILN